MSLKEVLNNAGMGLVDPLQYTGSFAINKTLRMGGVVFLPKYQGQTYSFCRPTAQDKPKPPQPDQNERLAALVDVRRPLKD